MFGGSGLRLSRDFRGLEPTLELQQDMSHNGFASTPFVTHFFQVPKLAVTTLDIVDDWDDHGLS